MPRDQESDERETLRALRQRDYRRALELVARGHAARIGRICFAMTGNQAEAEELTQEVLIAAYRAMPAFEGRSSVRTWIYTIARRTCARTLRRGRRRAGLLAAEALRAPDRGADDQLRAMESIDELQRLRRAVEQLPPSQREVLLLRFVGGLRFREVGQACGISEEAARQRASSGLRQLRRALVSSGARGADEQSSRAVFACQELSR